MDFNILELAVLFQNITLELHHSEYYKHLDSSLSTQFFTFKLGICVKCEVCLLMFAEGGHISAQTEICVCVLCRYMHGRFTLLKTTAVRLLP